MDLNALLDLYKQDPRTEKLSGLISAEKPSRIFLKGVLGSVDAFIASGVYKSRPRNHLFVLNNKEEAAYFQNNLENLLGKKDILFFPDSFKNPGQLEDINNSNLLLRTETVSRFLSSDTRGELLVTYPEAIIEKVVNTKVLKKSTLFIQTGERLDVDFIVELLIEYGFEHSDFVYGPGEFSVRGDIIDIYSYGNALPYRVELFGQEVETIRTFNPEDQLSVKKIRRVTIVPNIQTQFRSDDKVPLFTLLTAGTTIWIKDIEGLIEKGKNIFEKAAAFKDEMIEEDETASALLPTFIPSGDIVNALQKFNTIEFGDQSFLPEKDVISYNIKPQPAFNRQFDMLIENMRKQQEDGFLNFIFAGSTKQIERFYSIFEDLNAELDWVPVYHAIHSGFVDRDLKVSCFTDHQIFERYHKYHIKQAYDKSKALSLKLLRQLQPGDYVTHIDHGVGVYGGLTKMETNGQQQEMVRLVYSDNDLLFVNVNSLHKISKYVGKDGTKPRVSKLGSDAWQNLKRKAKRKIKDIAEDLIRLYAKRKASKGFAFSPDTYLQTELEASFFFEDTPDQLKATQVVKEDMEKITPMDRLVCGDVGFGKTEIAIRAAFKAVTDSKQAAVLVPTTILAWQHFQTFTERLKDFPVTVDYLNRFKSTKQRRETIERTKEGKVDILIGTHALLSKKIEFKDLGILIVDEEQKFGVAAKEKLRNIKVNVDTLTLTATPIPRTLQFSLMNARDLSIIQTPPPNRQPVTTELIAFDDEKLKDAINFEVYRGGQVFLVHNRVKDIEEVAALVKRICPSVEIGIAHGQMEGNKLEERMMNFINHKYDILLSTNIIESGLDIPNANTIIINNAQNHGLSDLHQLRGRVGRSNKKAFCYLITPPMHSLSTDARKRIQTITQFSDLGSGFQIAMRDLDIRGAGNLLGGEQSGFIADIGYETFHKILDEAMTELKTGEFRELFKEQMIEEQNFVRDCQIDTDLEMLIPDEYVLNVNERLSLYTELDHVENEEKLEAFKKKLIDRFGPLPTEVNELFNAVRLRWTAKKLGFDKILFKKKKLRCYFVENNKSPYYESTLFSRMLSNIQSQSKAVLKQSAKHLILIYDQVHSMKQARKILAKIDEEVNAKAPLALKE